MHTILIADADDHTLRARGDELLLDGYDVKTASTEHHARLKLAEPDLDALILAGLETATASIALLRQLRAGEIPRADPRIPVLALGADADHTAVRQYKAGADIALPSTASPLLVKGALDSLAARTGTEERRHRVLRTGGLRVDCEARAATLDGIPVALSRIEFDLLQTLASDPRRTFTKSELSIEVWGYDHTLGHQTRTLDTHASRLRQKLRAIAPDPLVHTVHGVGYRLTP